MTKHILRLIVTIAILAAVGLCLWLFVFKPTDTETTFALLENLDTYKESSGYTSDLAEIAEEDNSSLGLYTDETLASRYRLFGAGEATVVASYNVTNNSFKLDLVDYTINTEAGDYGTVSDGTNTYNIDSTNGFEIDGVSYLISTVEGVTRVTTTEQLSFYKDYNYLQVLTSLDEIYGVYSSYTLFAENVSNSQMNNISDKVDDYKSAIANVVISAQNLLEYESICKSAASGSSLTDGLKTELANRYADFSAKYKTAFNAYYDLILAVQGLVKSNVFYGDFVYDAQTSNLDIMLMLNSAFFNTTTDTAENIIGTPVTEISLTSEQIALKKACLAGVQYNGYNESNGAGWIDSGESTAVSSFLSAYLVASEDYCSDLNIVINANFNFFAVEELRTSTSIEGSVAGYSLSNISTAATEYLKAILRFCRIMGGE